MNEHNLAEFDNMKIKNELRGYSLSIRSITEGKKKYKIFELKKNSNYLEKQPAIIDIILCFTLFGSIVDTEIHLDITPERIFYKIPFFDDVEKAESIASQLADLLEKFPGACDKAGKVIDSLLQVKFFKPVHWQIIKSICIENKLRMELKKTLLWQALLLCKNCFTFYTINQVTSPIASSDATYFFGCRCCHESHGFLEGRSVAILDEQMTEKVSINENEISVNWIINRKPYDFHEIRIVNASDRDVEEFAMQVGNDLDEFRQSRYKKLPCFIAADCKLSQNNFRVLKHTFKTVKRIDYGMSAMPQKQI